MSEMLQLYRYTDLQKAGFGERHTVLKRVRSGMFPAPLDDGSGRPVWTRDMIEEYKASLKDYTTKPIERLQQATSQTEAA